MNKIVSEKIHKLFKVHIMFILFVEKILTDSQGDWYIS